MGSRTDGSVFGIFDGFTLDDAHTALGAAGFIPGLGAVADVLDAGLHVYEGNYGLAAINVVSAVPGVGDAAGGVLKAAVHSAAIGSVATKGLIACFGCATVARPGSECCAAQLV